MHLRRKARKERTRGARVAHRGMKLTTHAYQTMRIRGAIANMDAAL